MAQKSVFHGYTFRVTATDHLDNITTEEQAFGTASVTNTTSSAGNAW